MKKHKYTIEQVRKDRNDVAYQINDLLCEFEKKYDEGMIQSITWKRYDGFNWGKGTIHCVKIDLGL